MNKFYKNKKVLVTGNTGFKGSWLSQILLEMGAKVYGYALEPDTEALYNILGLQKTTQCQFGDICDYDKLHQFIQKTQPDIVFHLAAQPLVIEGFINPRGTYQTNIMGTVNVLDALKISGGGIRSFVNVTTDKVYRNNEWEYAYRENDILNGKDPYSNSKSCSELVTHCYSNMLIENTAISTMRAGNVIGGGDFSKDRIVPDFFRALHGNRVLQIRNPESVRPYQHVLEALYAYLTIAKIQYDRPNLQGEYNVGPNIEDCAKTKYIVECLNSYLSKDKVTIEYKNNKNFVESNLLRLDCSKIKTTFGWFPKWNIKDACRKTVEWDDSYICGDAVKCTSQQILEYDKLFNQLEIK